MGYDVKLLKDLMPYGISTLRIFEEIDSTSTEARRYAACGGSDTALFLADRQSGGRGRMGRSFYSPAGTGIYLSLLLPLTASSSDILLMTSAAAVAVRRAILEVTGVSVGIKWVNDLYLGGRKVCGILCEMLAEPRAMIIGVGINLYPTELPDDILRIAGAVLDAETDRGVREKLVAAVAGELLAIKDELSEGSFMDEYRDNSLVLGREIRYIENGVSHISTVTRIDERGRLCVREKNGNIRILSSGEISVRFE